MHRFTSALAYLAERVTAHALWWLAGLLGMRSKE